MQNIKFRRIIWGLNKITNIESAIVFALVMVFFTVVGNVDKSVSEREFDYFLNSLWLVLSNWDRPLFQLSNPPIPYLFGHAFQFKAISRFARLLNWNLIQFWVTWWASLFSFLPASTLFSFNCSKAFKN